MFKTIKSVSGTALWSLLCFIVAGVSRILAQTTSVIQGVVLDSQGQAITGAQIIVSNPALIGRIKIVSDAAGSYRAPGLQAGIYNLQAAQPGFSTKLYKDLAVTVNCVITFNIALDVSIVQETVTVGAKAPQLDTSIS